MVAAGLIDRVGGQDGRLFFRKDIAMIKAIINVPDNMQMELDTSRFWIQVPEHYAKKENWAGFRKWLEQVVRKHVGDKFYTLIRQGTFQYKLTEYDSENTDPDLPAIDLADQFMVDILADYGCSRLDVTSWILNDQTEFDEIEAALE